MRYNNFNTNVFQFVRHIALGQLIAAMVVAVCLLPRSASAEQLHNLDVTAMISGPHSAAVNETFSAILGGNASSLSAHDEAKPGGQEWILNCTVEYKSDANGTYESADSGTYTTSDSQGKSPSYHGEGRSVPVQVTLKETGYWKLTCTATCSYWTPAGSQNNATDLWLGHGSADLEVHVTAGRMTLTIDNGQKSVTKGIDQKVTLTATLTGGTAPLPQVKFYAGNTLFATQPVTNGVATAPYPGTVPATAGQVRFHIETTKPDDFPEPPGGDGSPSGDPAANEADCLWASIAVTVIDGATQQNLIQDQPAKFDQNWAHVKTTGGWVIVKAVTNPDNETTWGLIDWGNDGGENVDGHKNERRYSIASAKKFMVQPTLGATNPVTAKPLAIWSLWAILTIDDTGQNPANAPLTPPFPHSYGGQALGLQYYDSSKSVVDFKICAISKLQPSGINKVLSGGCIMRQERKTHRFKNITEHGSVWDTQWVSDDFLAPYFTKTPDSDDRVYGVDGPNEALYSTSQQEHYGNFRDWMTWNGIMCSKKYYWYFQAGAKSGHNPVIYFADGGVSKVIPIPDNDPQKLEAATTQNPTP